MTLQKKIEENRRKHARFKKYEQVLRRIRLRIFDYEDAGKSEKATRIIEKIKKIMAPLWEARVDAVFAEKMQNYHM